MFGECTFTCMKWQCLCVIKRFCIIKEVCFDHLTFLLTDKMWRGEQKVLTDQAQAKISSPEAGESLSHFLCDLAMNSALAGLQGCRGSTGLMKSVHGLLGACKAWDGSRSLALEVIPWRSRSLQAVALPLLPKGQERSRPVAEHTWSTERSGYRELLSDPGCERAWNVSRIPGLVWAAEKSCSSCSSWWWKPGLC